MDKILMAMLATTAVLVAGCGGGNTGGGSAVTGPTNPSVVVTCLGDSPGAGSGNASIVTTVDCGDRSTGDDIAGTPVSEEK